MASEAVSRTGTWFGAAFLVALLIVLNVFPQWVGLWAGPAREGRFMPVLSPAYAEHLPLLNTWITLAIVLKVLLYKRRRWEKPTRWLELLTGAVGTMTLLRMASGPPLVAPPDEWLDLHGWPPDQHQELQDLLAYFPPMVQLGLLVAFVVLLVVTLVRLYRLVDFTDQARKLVQEGLGGRGLGGTFELFRQDAGRAYHLLDRDRHFGPTPEEPFDRFFHGCKVVFRGIATQLTPARRLLFVAALLLAVPGRTRWLAVVGLLFLLVIELVDRIQVRDEVELARALQRDLLPSSPPEPPGWVVANSYRTANAIGGDYHDFEPTADGRLALVVGDASGHGMAAALIMAIGNATLKAAIDVDPEPLKVLTRLNQALFRTGGRKAFMTCFYGVLEPENGRLEYACAGHPFPLLLQAGGEIRELGTGALPLGINETVTVTPEAVSIEPGDRLLLYSDGLPEALDGPEGTAFGFGRLRELLAAGGPAREIHDRVLVAFDEHVGSAPLADDLTLVVVHRLSGPSR